LSRCNALQINPAALFEPDGAERQKAREAIIRLASQFIWRKRPPPPSNAKPRSAALPMPAGKGP